MRRGVYSLLVVSVCLAGPAGGTQGAPRRVALGAGEKAFWRGPYVQDARSGSGCREGSCWTYQIEIAERARRLRIGIDHPEVGDSFSFKVRDPSGALVGHAATGTGLYSAETRHSKPARGVWTIRVRAEDVDRSAFRMRAKLEKHRPRLGARRGPVLPNLQILPPHEASFLVPLTNGSQGDPPRGEEGPDSCHPEERALDGAVRCLRFAFGIRNTGRGPLQLYFRGYRPPEDRKLFQRIQRVGGDYRDRRAGIARWHVTHGHYHHHDAAEVKLFRVTDAAEGVLEPASPRHRKGFAHRDELLREWRRFYPTWRPFGFGLGAGWSDIYEWDRPGNYVDFGSNGDGLFVIRMWADPVDGIRESNERDNAGYTYLEVTESDVELIEAGRGRHPWDPCKIVVGFGGHPNPPRGPRPDHCPPDTT